MDFTSKFLYNASEGYLIQWIVKLCKFYISMLCTSLKCSKNISYFQVSQCNVKDLSFIIDMDC